MKIAVIEPLGIAKKVQEELAAKIIGDKADIVFYDDIPASQEETIRRCQGAEAVIIANMAYGADIIRACPDLKFISVAFTGVDHVAVDYCHKHDITVSNCAGYSTQAVAELTIGMAINLLRQIKEGDAAVRAGKTRAGLRGGELGGRNFGIIGTGAIGMRTAELARAFGCKIYAYSRTFKNYKDIEYVSLPDLMKLSDIVSVHVPLNDNTRGMIGEKLLRLMKPQAVLVNTARGSVVSSKALAEALRQGWLAAAAVDVFDCEPPLELDNILLQAPNLLATPHIGFSTDEALNKRAEIALQNVAGWIGGFVQNVVK